MGGGLPYPPQSYEHVWGNGEYRKIAKRQNPPIIWLVCARLAILILGHFIMHSVRQFSLL